MLHVLLRAEYAPGRFYNADCHVGAIHSKQRLRVKRPHFCGWPLWHLPALMSRDKQSLKGDQRFISVASALVMLAPKAPWNRRGASSKQREWWEGGVKSPHSKALRAFSWFLGAR